MPEHNVVSREKWLVARKEHLANEKEFTRLRDELSRLRRELPWVKVEKRYEFETSSGTESLQDLFAGRSQLLVYHFMYGADWEEGCPSCSFWADNFSGVDVHLAHRDMTLVVISNAPLAALDAYKKRMGWSFKWVSSLGSDFNPDYHVSFDAKKAEAGELYYNYETRGFPSEEGPGASAFIRGDDGSVYHTYSTYARGLDMLNGAYHWMDIAPKGRDEDALPHSMAWLRRHDQYED